LSAVKAGVRAVADEARESPDRRQYGRFTPATWAEGASILMTILACRPSLIDPNQIGSGTTSIGPSASALTERLASSQGRHSKSSHCLESAPRISSVNADAATTNGGFGKRPLASLLIALPACNARVGRRDELASTGRATICRTNRAPASRWHTRAFLCRVADRPYSSRRVASKRSHRPVTLVTSCSWERSFTMIRAELAEPAEDSLVLISSGFYDAYWNARP